MATKTILKDAKAPLLFLAAAPKPQLIQKPLLHLSGLRHYLYQQPSTKVDGVGLGGALDSTFGPQSRVQARRSDDEEDDHIEELEDEDDSDDFDDSDDSEDFSDEEDEEDKLNSEFKFDHDEKKLQEKAHN